MPVVDHQLNPDECTLRFVADFAAPVERVWQLYADPRQLEQIWGTPEFPSRFVEHTLEPGSTSKYSMHGEDVTYYGYWAVLEAEAPRRFVVRDGFANEDFTPKPGLPESVMTTELTEHEGGTRAVYTSQLANREEFDQMVEMGVVDGTISAINQVDAFLAH